jgi:leucyl aminopeptidase (aminopeptidase T)
MLTNGALALTVEEHRKMQNFASALIQKLKNAVKVEVKNSMGTDLSLRVKGRPFFTDTIINWETMKWMNLPTGEVIVAPIEDSLNGKLVCDMAVGGIGPLKTPVKIIIHNGKAEEIVSEDLQVLKRVKDSSNTDEWAKVVGEFAFGINPKARFVEEFLEAEKILGTIHIAFGNNSDMPGGKNKSKNHMDLLISKPDVKIFYEDGSSFDILKTGVFQPF